MPKVLTSQIIGNQGEALVAYHLSKFCLVRPVAAGTDIGVDLYCESITDNQSNNHPCQASSLEEDDALLMIGRLNGLSLLATNRTGSFGLKHAAPSRPRVSCLFVILASVDLATKPSKAEYTPPHSYILSAMEHAKAYKISPEME